MKGVAAPAWRRDWKILINEWYSNPTHVTLRDSPSLFPPETLGLTPALAAGNQGRFKINEALANISLLGGDRRVKERSLNKGDLQNLGKDGVESPLTGLSHPAKGTGFGGHWRLPPVQPCPQDVPHFPCHIIHLITTAPGIRAAPSQPSISPCWTFQTVLFEMPMEVAFPGSLTAAVDVFSLAELG